MAWEFLPVSVNNDITAEQINEIATGINERGGSVTPISINADLSASTINNFRSAIESLIPTFWDNTRSIPYTKANLFADAVIGDGNNWTRNPARLGEATYGTLQSNDDACIEHINEMRLVLNKLTKKYAYKEYIGGGEKSSDPFEMELAGEAKAAAESDFAGKSYVGGSMTTRYYNNLVGYGNYYIDTLFLDEDIDSSDLRFDIDGVGTTGDYASIGSEILQVGSISGGEMFITARGVLGTTATSHSSGIMIVPVVPIYLDHLNATGNIIEFYFAQKNHEKIGTGWNGLPDISVLSLEMRMGWTKQYVTAPYQSANITITPSGISIADSEISDDPIITYINKTLSIGLYPIGGGTLALEMAVADNLWGNDPVAEDMITGPSYKSCGKRDNNTIFSKHYSLNSCMLIYEPNYTKRS